MPDIAVYGLGAMGADITRCIVGRKVGVAAYDPVAAPRIDSPGFHLGRSVNEVAPTARVHLIVVRKLADLNTLLFGDDGLSTCAPDGSLIVLHTTVTPQVARELRQRVDEASGHTFIDAALSRRGSKVSEGSLSLLVGGTDIEFAAARPVLDVYADNVLHVGPPGAGMTAKLCNNWLLYGNRHAALQALRAGRALGLDVDVLRGALTTSTGSSWALTHYSDLDAAILEGRGAPTDVLDRTFSELNMAREMMIAAGEVPTTLQETFALLDAMRRTSSSDAGLPS